MGDDDLGEVEVPGLPADLLPVPALVRETEEVEICWGGTPAQQSHHLLQPLQPALGQSPRPPLPKHPGLSHVWSGLNNYEVLFDLTPTETILGIIHNRTIKMVNGKSLVSFIHGDVFVVLEGLAQNFNEVSIILLVVGKLI